MTKKIVKTPKKKANAAAKLSPATPRSSTPRKLKRPTYKSMQLSKRIKHPARLLSAWKITKAATTLLWRHKRLFIGITIIYGVLNLVLVRGFAAGSTDVAGLKNQLSAVFGGNFGGFASSLTIFALLVSSSGNSSSSTAGAYQLFIVLLVSLAIIWALRQVTADVKIRIRDAYYRGIYPLVPFLLVLLVIGLQLLPLLIGTGLYSLVINNGIAVYGPEKFLWAMLAIVLGVLSIYMVSSSIFALYIVTLPDMTPMKALRSARELVRYRRWTVVRKLLFLPLIMLIAAGVIMVPIIVWLTPMAQWIFFILTMFSVVAVHAYVYTLYRDLLHD